MLLPRIAKNAIQAPSQYLLECIRSLMPSPANRLARGSLSLIKVFKARAQLTVGVQPISPETGYGRGTPINRYYLEQFLQKFSSDICGYCLEFQEDLYTSRFGGGKVTKLDILHREAGNRKATIVADLTTPNDIPSNWFDCIVCTYVLHSIFELDKAVLELHRILKPGGVLLVAVPHIAKYRPQYTEAWRFTPEGLHLVLGRVFEARHITVLAYGNSLTAAGNIRGLAAHEFTKAELNYHDPSFAVGVFARACKQS